MKNLQDRIVSQRPYERIRNDAANINKSYSNPVLCQDRKQDLILEVLLDIRDLLQGIREEQMDDSLLGSRM